jgi:hypothetical protein
MSLTSWQQPHWSEESTISSKARSHVIVRNQYVEISSDESGMDTSPTPQLGSVFKTGNVANKHGFLSLFLSTPHKTQMHRHLFSWIPALNLVMFSTIMAFFIY